MVDLKKDGCDSEKEVVQLFYMIVQSAKDILGPEVRMTPIGEAELETKDWEGMNLVAVTDIVNFYKKWYSIYFDPAFYSLKTEYQISTLIHELAHVQNAWQLLNDLETGQITADEFDERLDEVMIEKGHDKYWEEIAKNIAKKFGTDPNLPCIKYIDFTDDQFWLE